MNDRFAKKEQRIEKSSQFLWEAATRSIENAELSRTLVHDLSDVISDKGGDKETFGRFCKKCGTIRNESNSFYRLRPKRKQGKSTQKALKKQKAHSKNSKKTERTIKKFIKSSSMLVIHCKVCSFYEKVPTVDRSGICQIKSLEKKKTVGKKSGSTAGEKSTETTPSRKRKSVESFLNTSTSSSSKPSTPKNKKRRSSHLSMLLSDEKSKPTNAGLMDFLKNI